MEPQPFPNEPPRPHSHSETQGRDETALAELFEQSRRRLRRLVEMRMDRRIKARVDPSDVIQEAFAEAVKRFPSYQQDPRMSAYVWLRFLTMQQLLIAHRRHLATKSRSASAELPISLDGGPALESESMADLMLGNESTPSVKVARAEEHARLTAAIQQMEELDREVLILRHFEQLEHAQIAEILKISRDAVSSRHHRALKKLGEAIAGGGG